MIIVNQYGKVEFDLDFNEYKKIGIGFSGGCDSTLLFYLLLKLFEESKPNAKIIPITGITINKGKWKLLRSQQILDELLIQFPSCEKYVEDRQINFNWSQEEYSEFTEKLFDENIVDIRIFGLTKNPPYDVMKEHNLLFEREKSRDNIDNILLKSGSRKKGGPTYDPLRNIDKRWIAQCYKDFKLMDNIYPLTSSCERLRETYDMIDNEDPCKHCWWCKEKKMAFGTYDGGIS